MTVNTDSHSHKQVLRTLSNLATDAEEVGSLKSLVSEVILRRLKPDIRILHSAYFGCKAATYVAEIPIVDDGGVESFFISHDCLVA